MSNIRKQSSSRSARRGRERHVRRLGLEALEPRACPAVMFEFVQGDEGGVLSITGDEGPNVIEIFQPRDGVVEVLGDGEWRTFEGVDEVDAFTQGGDDSVMVTHRPNTISSMNYQLSLGAGNDKVMFDDGGPRQGTADDLNIYVCGLDLAVALGTGADQLTVQAHRSHDVNVNVSSLDGFDIVAIELLVPASEAIITSGTANIQLKWLSDNPNNDVGNQVDVRTKGFGRVDLEMLAPGGGNTVQFAGDADGYRDVYMDEPLPPWCMIDLDFGGGGNLVTVNTKDFVGAALHLKALVPDGNNVVEINQGWGPWEISPGRIADQTPISRADIMLAGDGNKVGFETRGYEQVDLDLDLTGNSNTVAIGMLLPAVQQVRVSAARIDLNLSGDDNAVDVHTTNIDEVDLGLVAEGDRNAIIAILIGTIGPAVQKARSARIDLSLAGGDNVVDVRTTNMDDVTLDMLALGGNNVVKHELGHTLGFRHEHTRPESAAHANLLLMGDGNEVGFNTEGYERVDLDLDLTGDSNQVAVGLRKGTWILDSSARIEMDLDGGGNFVGVQTQHIRDVALNVRESTASSAVSVTQTGNVYTITFGGSLNTQLDIKTGDGDDTVHATVLPSVTDLVIDPFDAARMNIDVGEGDDNILIVVYTRGVADLQLDLATGAGDDTVEVDSRVLYIGTGETNGDVNLDLGDGNDVAEISIDGFFNVSLGLTAGPGNDDVQVQAVTGRITGIAIDPTSGEARSDIFIDAGDGDDSVKYKMLFAPLIHDLDGRARLEIETLLGTGDDRLEIVTSGYADANIFIDADDGDDVVFARHRTFSVVDRTKLNFVVLLGLGSDTLVLETCGYQTIRTSVDTGPEEDGSDTISASHHSLSPASHGRGVYQLYLDDGDAFEGLAVGYAVQEPVGDGVVVEWVFGVELPRV